MDDPQTQYLLLFLFFVAIVLFISFVLLVIATLGDWGQLATRFRASDAPKGKYFYCQTAGVGDGSYRGMLTVGVTEEGLYLAVLLPFRLFHPPLLIPWKEITHVHESHFLAWRNCYLGIGYPEWASIVVYNDVVEAIRPHLVEVDLPEG
ncbi:hypothetical protein ACYFX5_17490 [Bremerella sp. T1]|uniref:hypothetical protein n=1 Tax=Bremerella sp. TYQ1 TaxID=3119568 RepID=UPI001CCDE1C2|nr:hypothetical protein [Bremerella volcania]UBM34851.1 hypothetical protein LA756_19440 [Bremerella volcania]